jgi:hypothetical protein
VPHRERLLRVIPLIMQAEEIAAQRAALALAS